MNETRKNYNLNDDDDDDEDDDGIRIICDQFDALNVI